MAIINDNDMEIILSGDQKKAIRNMLENRLFAVINMPAEKPSDYTSPFSSSIFVSHMHWSLCISCAIRNRGERTVFEKCEYYIYIYKLRGQNEENIFTESLNDTAFSGTTVTHPSVDEFINFMASKELFFITNLVEDYGNMEDTKVKVFQNDYLLIRENYDKKFILHDDFFDVKVSLTKINDGSNESTKYGLLPIDIRHLDINARLLNILENSSRKEYEDENYYCTQYESNSPDIHASYFLTCFHSNTNWSADPINILNFRLSAFVLPGLLPKKRLHQKKITKEINGESMYKIEAIHFNSDICFDIVEFKELTDEYLYNIGLD